LGSYRASFSLGTGNFTTKQRDVDAIGNVLSFRIEYFDYAAKTGFAEWHKGWGNIAFLAEVVEL
jgi:hypothetical protein